MLKFLNISDFLIGISSCSEIPSKCALTISFFIQYETFYKILQNKSLHNYVGHLAIYVLKHIK